VHAGGDAKVFYQQLAAPALIGMEAGCPSIRAKALSRAKISCRCFCTVCFAREVEDQDSGNLTLNHFPAELVVPPTIDTA
jgi:hypothetical protein